MFFIILFLGGKGKEIAPVQRGLSGGTGGALKGIICALEGV
jgi:hypothetical protein